MTTHKERVRHGRQTTPTLLDNLAPCGVLSAESKCRFKNSKDERSFKCKEVIAMRVHVEAQFQVKTVPRVKAIGIENDADW